MVAMMFDLMLLTTTTLPFINGDSYGEVRDDFYESSCEGSKEKVLDQRCHISGAKEQRYVGESWDVGGTRSTMRDCRFPFS
jgi:hypothetical protein